MNVRPKYPLWLPVFLRPGWSVSRKINALVPKLLTDQRINQLETIEGHTNLRQCATLFYLAYTAAKAPGKIVEIGSFKGKSTCWMARACSSPAQMRKSPPLTRISILATPALCLPIRKNPASMTF